MSTSQVVPFTTSAPGLNAFSALMGGFTQPAVNATVDVVIRLGQWAVKGQTIYIENGGVYKVQRKVLNADGSVTATLLNIGDPSNAAAGSSVPIGDCSPAGASGPAGASSTTGVAGIGALGSGGFLRTIKGAIGAIGIALHVGGWGSLQDGGQGSFYWNATDTRPDDGGFSVVRPDGAGVGPSDPGRWNRLWAGGVMADWGGCVGDGVHDNGTAGTDDRAALQAAIDFAGQYAHRLYLNPRKVYVCNGSLNASYSGLVIDGQGSLSFTHGSWIKFTGAHDDVMLQISSVNGVQLRGVYLHGYTLTRAAADHTYADQATRLAAGLTTLGTTADQTDTGQRWRLIATPSSSAANWRLASYAMIGVRQTNWGGILGPGGADSLGIIFSDCIILGPPSYVMQQGIQFGQTDCSKAVNCTIQYFVYGITSNDQYWGGGAGICIDIDTCNFGAIKTRSIYQPFSNWTIRNCSFEVRADGSLDGVEVSTSAGGQSSNIVCIGNIHPDATAAGGSCYRFTNALGVTLIGNQGYTVAGGTFVYLASCFGVEVHGNMLFGMTKAYDIEATGNPCAAMKLGPDYGNLPPNGTNYRNTLVFTMDSGLSTGGLSWGGNNTFTAYDGMAVGTNNTVGQSAMSVGFNNTASSTGFASGQNGIGRDSSERVLAGGINTGTNGGSQLRENVFSSNTVVGGGATTSLKKSDTTTNATLDDSRIYTAEITFVVGKNASSIAYTTKLVALIKRVSGVATVLATATAWTLDPGTTGITVSVANSSGNLNIAVTNPTAQTLYAEASLRLSGTYSL